MKTQDFREFPGGLVVRIQCFHCRGLGSVPGQGNEIPQAVRRGQKKEKKKKKTQDFDFISLGRYIKVKLPAKILNFVYVFY